jgi:hypothetical protein
MTPTKRRYTVLLSVLIEEEDANGRTVSIGYAPTGGNDGLEQAIARQLSMRGWTEGAVPDLPFSDAARRWDARLPEEFGETILSEPDPVAWSEHDTLLDALLEIQAMFDLEDPEAPAAPADATAPEPPTQPGVIFMATKVTDPKETAQRLYAELQRQIEERRSKATGQ